MRENEHLFPYRASLTLCTCKRLCACCTVTRESCAVGLRNAIQRNQKTEIGTGTVCFPPHTHTHTHTHTPSSPCVKRLNCASHCIRVLKIVKTCMYTLAVRVNSFGAGASPIKRDICCNFASLESVSNSNYLIREKPQFSYRYYLTMMTSYTPRDFAFAEISSDRRLPEREREGERRRKR